VTHGPTHIKFGKRLRLNTQHCDFVCYATSSKCRAPFVQTVVLK